MLGIEKPNWARATKVCKDALANGYTLEDFVQATEEMKKGDKKYWSIYSVFTKTDYWVGKSKQVNKLKGVW